MKLTKRGGGAFNPHDEGTFRAVCVDVTPLVKQTSGKYGDREVFRLVFETDAPAREDGSRPCVWSRGFTPSLNEKANFRKFLRQWFGRDLTAAEEAEFDTEALLGKAAQVTIIHEHSDNGDTYATIVACVPYRGNDPLQASGKFTRKKDREAKGEEASYRGAAKPTEPVREAEAVDTTQAGDDWATVKVHVGKFAGVEVRDLDPEAIEKLNKNWVPNAGTTAADQRLVKALKRAQEELAAATAGEEY